MDVVAWLLEGDPAVRWQVHRDLLDAAPAEVAAQRRLVAQQGWGARLLAAQDPDGRWAGALYSPKWTSTTYTLLLDRLGLPRGDTQALAGCRVLWDAARWWDGGLNLARTVREPETCITAMLVLLAAGFGYDDPRAAGALGWLLDEQLGDGGWNCETVRTGSTHGSFHTTIGVLEALERVRRAGAAAGSPRPDVTGALAAGREFLLGHRLFRSHRTGAVIDPACASRSRPSGTTTCCGVWSTSPTRTPPATSGSRTRSRWFGPPAAPTGPGGATGPGRAASGSPSKRPAPAAGPPCEPCVCSPGGGDRSSLSPDDWSSDDRHRWTLPRA